MEVVSANNGLLTNLEVLDILKEHKDKRNDKQPAVEKQAIKFMQQSAVAKLSTLKCRQYLREISLITQGCLTEAEVLQISNHIPSQPVEIHLLIEECPERLTDKQVDDIAALGEQLMTPTGI